MSTQMRGRLALLARELGWPPLRMRSHRLPRHVSRSRQPAEIVWHESTHPLGITLQINEGPAPCACVIAVKYRLFTGWHELGDMATRRSVLALAKRLRPWLHVSCFRTAHQRALYRKRHPECAGFTWAKLRAENANPARCRVYRAAPGQTASKRGKS